MLRLGVLLGSRTWRWWETECVKSLLDTNGVAISVIVIHEEEDGAGAGPFLYRELKRLADRSARTLKRQPLRSVLGNVPVVEWDANRCSRTEELSAYRLDVVVSFRQQPPDPELVGVPRHGVWEFAYGEERVRSVFDDSYRCLLYRRPTVTVSLIRRQAGRYAVLKEGTTRAKRQSYFRNIDAANDLGLRWPSVVCRDVMNGNAPYLERWREPAGNEAAPAFGGTAAEALKLGLSMGGCKLRNFVRHWFVAERWNVGIADRPIHSFLEKPNLSRTEWLPKRSRYAADPFGIRMNGAVRILYEEFDYSTGKGVLRTADYAEGFRADGGTTDLELPVHLSYPYLFTHEDRIYCIPESNEASRATLYRADEYPRRWAKVRDILENFRAVDSTVIRHEGRWWLFCTDGEKGPDSHLHIWYASEPEGEWKAHPLNPVKTDIRSSRPAGTPFYWKGRLYRPAQDCSETYGGAVTLNRIVALTTEDFEEAVEARLTPDPNGPYPAGWHTLSSVGERTLIDSKTEAFHWQAFVSRVKAKLRAGRERERASGAALPGRVEEKEGCYAE
ncbi:hypothetical protein [Cohnella hongkongensis]|uniref:Glucosamine inositolphosphorylceramide transferase 1 N-terminal domain-containing protein n=1 Tax=Cohnella hongkongensis TaxID=178337 RepID=A0ABV9F9M5_9BACL